MLRLPPNASPLALQLATLLAVALIAPAFAQEDPEAEDSSSPTDPQERTPIAPAPGEPTTAPVPPVAPQDAPRRARDRSITGSDPVGASPIAEGLEAQFGRGVTLASPDGDLSLTLRGRLQLRGFAHSRDGERTDLGFQVRRARVVFLGRVPQQRLVFYIQLGLSPLDMEPDLRIPVRDAVVTWLGHRDVNLRAGQMKVPFSRERVISSSALQFADRSIVNAELNLDRDVGVQLFSNDLFGLGGYLGYQIGVFGGEGRNRVGPGPGLLYVMRLQAQPFGRFDDAFEESSLSRDPRPRLSVGASFAYNHEAQRTRSTHGEFFALGTFNLLHAEADLIFKAEGFSAQAEVLGRWTQDNPLRVVLDGAQRIEAPPNAIGFMTQAGYIFPLDLELAGRFAQVHPLGSPMRSSVGFLRELVGTFGWYGLNHDLKLQLDYSYLFGQQFRGGDHLARIQFQLFF